MEIFLKRQPARLSLLLLKKNFSNSTKPAVKHNLSIFTAFVCKALKIRLFIISTDANEKQKNPKRDA